MVDVIVTRADGRDVAIVCRDRDEAGRYAAAYTAAPGVQLVTITPRIPS